MKNQHFSSRTRAGLIMALAAVVISGCSVLPKSETLVVYQLPATASAAQPLQAAHAPAADTTWALRVDTPYSNQLIASERIVVRPPGDRVSAYKGARWGDTAPILLRDRLIAGFRSQAPGISISSDSTRLQSDRVLASDLSAFHVEYSSGAPVVHMQLDASLVNTADNRAVATRRFRVSQAVDGKELPEVVAAFGLAADALTQAVVQWALQHPPPSSVVK